MRKLYKNRVIIILLMIFYFKPICLQYYSDLRILENFFVYGKILVSCSVLLIFLSNIFERKASVKINKFLLSVLLFELWMLFVSIYQQGDVFRSFIDCVTIFIFSVYTYYGIKENYVQFFKALRSLLFILVVLQLISAIVYPSGMPANLYTNNALNRLFFITIDNGTTGLIIACISINYFVNHCEHALFKRKYNLILNLSCMLTAFIVGSSTAIICSTLLLLLIWFESFSNLWILNKRWVWILLYVIAFIMMLYLSSGGNMFTGRAFIWSKAIEMIKVNSLIGYGKQSFDLISVWGMHQSSHNVILQIALEGGIIGLIIWANTVWRGVKNIKFVSNYKFRIILFFSVYVLLISLLMEAVVHSIYLFMLLSILASFPQTEIKIIKGSEV